MTHTVQQRLWIQVSVVAFLCSTASSAAAISNGNPSDREYVVYAKSGDTLCSAILATPRWLLLANHCVTGTNTEEGWGVNSTVTVKIPQNDDPADGTPDDRKFNNCNQNECFAPHLVQTTDSINGISSDDSSRDFALVRLGTRVPSTITKPLHPPIPSLGSPTCPHDSSFNGMIVGFGKTKLVGSEGPPARHEHASDGWYRDADHAYGATYVNQWIIPGAITNNFYYGAENGDSGGPLVYEPQGSSSVLCGVMSRWGLSTVVQCEVCFPFVCCFALPTLLSEYGDVENIGGWLDEHIMQDRWRHGLVVSHWFEGECEDNPDDDQDDDGDGIPDSCDICPGKYNPNQVDDDHDGVGNECDKCPGVDDLLDADCDGCPDDVDPCPGEGNLSPEDNFGLADTSCGDVDLDGVCNSADNCPFTANPYQRNDNLLEETLWTPTKIWGNACEPPPQPSADSTRPQTTTLFDIESGGIHAKTVLSINDGIRLRPQASRGVLPFPQPSVPVCGVDTHWRFCQPDGSANIVCDDKNAVSDFQVHLELASWMDEHVSDPYHRVTLDSQGATPGAFEAYCYDGLGLAHDAHYDRTWLYEADTTRWLMSGIVDVPAQEPLAGPASGLGGMFWIYAATLVGADQAHDVGTGWHGPNLANRHFLLDPEHVSTTFSSNPKPLSKPFFIWQTLPDPGPIWRLGAVAGDGNLLVRAAPAGQWGLMNFDGSVQVVTDRLGPALLQALNDSSIVWANAAEPSYFMGRADVPIFVGVDALGTSVAETAMLGPAGDQLLGRLDRGVIGLTPGDPPPPSKGFALAYSRFLRALYLVGGEDPSTHAPFGTIWRYALSDQDWSQMPTAMPIGKALAATVSFRDRGLYVLDETTADGLLVCRLLRFDALSGAGTVLGSWPRKAQFDTLWMELDRDGSVLVVASDDAMKKHAVVRIRVGPASPNPQQQEEDEDGAQQDEEPVALVYKNAHALQWPMLVDANGYVFYRRKPNGTIQVKREAALHDFDGGWAALGGLL